MVKLTPRKKILIVLGLIIALSGTGLLLIYFNAYRYSDQYYHAKYKSRDNAQACLDEYSQHESARHKPGGPPCPQID